MKLLLATSNKGKVQEYSHLLRDLPLQLVVPSDFDIQEKPGFTLKRVGFRFSQMTEALR